MPNPIEVWKSEKHPFDVWPDVEKHAVAGTAMKEIPTADLERMKWHGFFYRKRDAPGRYMNRIRLTACELNAEQAREIARIAYDCGHGIVDITTRANVQVQGLEVAHLPQVAKRLEAVNLSSRQTGHDNIRNVFGHPFTGLLPDELIDVRQISRDVSDIFLDSREYSNLPRKLNICINGTSQHAAHFWTQDISFLATRTDGEVGSKAGGEVVFQMLIGGTQGQTPRLAWHLPVIVRPEQVVDVTRSLIDLFRAKGSREKRNTSRLRFLIEEIGIGGVLDWLEETLPFRLHPCVGEPSPAAVTEEYVGWFRQADPNLWTMGLCVPLGRLTWQQLEGLALSSKRWGSGQLRTTPEQGIALVDIPTAFKDAAATDAASFGLSVHADAFDRNTMACTGSQFCNIAVTETKGHMFRLVDTLRKRALKLHGIRIHMSGCPASCAQHFTADIGLKGVRVRRLLGTREGFDVYLGGGLAGQVHMALPFKLGVDVDQLPTLIDEVVSEYYLRHKTGQTFSMYWREKLQTAQANKVVDEDYKPPVWLCESCQYEHIGEDPPIFCPSCAALRRHFARLENDVSSNDAIDDAVDSTSLRNDNFVFAANESALSDNEGLTVEVQGREFALFRIEGKVRCVDSLCPHEGASLADGEVKNGMVVCPWHGWEFDTCTGCSIDPPGNDISTYETLTENGVIFIRPTKSTGPNVPKGKTANTIAKLRAEHSNSKPVEAVRTVLDVIQETPDVRTFRLDNSDGSIPFDFPGQFAKVCIPGDDGDIRRSFTISSSPSDKRHLDLTIKLNPDGLVTPYLFEHIKPGGTIKLKGAQGGFFFDASRHSEPLVLVSAGSGVTPMMSIARTLAATNANRPCVFLYGARTPTDLIFHEECKKLAAAHSWFRYVASLSQPENHWEGESGRVDFNLLSSLIETLAACRFFLCGPNEFMESLQVSLTAAGVSADQIHVEQFHKLKMPTTA